MTSLVTNVRKWKRPGVFIIALSVVGFLFGLSYRTPLILGLSSQYPCVGIGGWPCGYTGPFTGDYYAGYATLGCTPINPNSTCVVPQIAMMSSFLVIDNASYVIGWANQSFQWIKQLSDGSTMSVSGKLAPIFYNKTAGSTFLIYHSNVRGLWDPQPGLQIQNATLTTQPIVSTCTTTLTFTVSGPSNGVSNLPMIPAGACYIIRNTTQQPHAIGSVDIPISVTVLASSFGVGVIIVGTRMFLRKPH